MPTTIAPERPDSADALGLIAELEEHLAPRYPSESRHGLNIEQLIVQNVAFFVLRADGQPAACGGVKLYGLEYGELKRMYVLPAYRGRGIARRMVAALEEAAHATGRPEIRLETGTYLPAAIALYRSVGYAPIPPYGEYVGNPYSVCFAKRLTASIQ